MSVIDLRTEQWHRPVRHHATQAMEVNDTRSWVRSPAFGQLIRATRQRRGWTVEALAVRVGYDCGSMARIERNERPCEYDIACRIADILGEPKIEELAAYLVMQRLRRPDGPEAA